MRLLSGVFLVILSAATSAADKPLVRWLTMDFPPYHIQQGDDAGTGTHDKFLRKLQAELPEFTHTVEPSSSSRMEALMKAGAPACSVSKLKTPAREAFSIFSRKAFFSLLPIRLVTMRLDPINRLADDDMVSLDALLKSDGLRLGLLDTRRYGEPIDHLLSAAATDRVVYFRADPLVTTALVMMERGRFNATLAYSVEIEYLRRTSKLGTEVRYLPLKESSRLLDVHVSCARTAVGRRVIDAIDRLAENRPSVQELAADYENYLSADERRRYATLRSPKGD